MLLFRFSVYLLFNLSLSVSAYHYDHLLNLPPSVSHPLSFLKSLFLRVNLQVVKLLLQHGADPNARDNWNYTPLHEAAIKGKIDVCIVLLQHGADPTIRNTDGKTAIELADPSAKVVLMGEYKKDELLEASRSGNEERMQALLTPMNVNRWAD